MSNITPFKFESTEVRTITDEHGEPWFVLRDMLDAMQSKTKTTDAVESVKQGLGEGFVNDVPLKTDGGEQRVIIVAEAAATYLLSRSNTETGRKLNRFVHVDVLPALRKTGRYALPDAPCISPAQQRQIQNAIAERFPDGKYRPYAWSRFNNHFQLGSYKQLPAAKTEEALAYIAEMPQLSTETERERYVRELLQVGRFLVSFDRLGLMQVSEIPAEAVVATGAQMVRLIGEPGVVDRAELPSLIEAAAKRLRTA